MDRPLTLTKEMLETILLAVSNQTPHLASGVYTEGIVTVDDVKEINEALERDSFEGPCVIIDISDPVGMRPGHLSSTLNSFGNDLCSIAEESKKGREAIEMGFMNVVQKLDEIKNTQPFVPDYTSALRELITAVQSVADLSILRDRLVSDSTLGPRLDVAAGRVLDLLNRRPELRDAVKERMNGG